MTVITRREFAIACGGAAAWPIAALGQQAVAVVGFLEGNTNPSNRNAVRRGLNEIGYVEGTNLTIEYRTAGDQFDQLPTLARGLVLRRVNVIVASGSTTAVAAKAATTTIPIVFFTGGDPVELGLVASLNRPGGNVTGISRLSHELLPKQLEILDELVPKAPEIVVLLHQDNVNTVSDSGEFLAAARSVGKQVRVLNISTDRDIAAAFDSIAPGGAIVVGPGSFLAQRSQPLITFAAHRAIPTIYAEREFVEAGGLMSYDASQLDAHRLVGIYTGRILKGEKPADLPVQQSTKVELTINMKTAKALGLTVPLTLLGRADEVIE
jgi:putative ABC transport system substrate-binding protein